MNNEMSALHAHIKELEASNQEYSTQMAELKSISRLQKEWNEYDKMFFLILMHIW